MKEFVKLTREERETYYRVDDVTDECVADSSIQKDIRKLIRQGWIKVDEKRYPDGTIMWAKFKAPRKCISPRKYDPDKPKRVISEEHKQKASQALKEYWEKQSN